VYLFEEGNTGMRQLLGGKGADLAEMTRIGLTVPPGITITTAACREYSSLRTLPNGLWEEVLEKFHVVEAKAGKVFGDSENPLLVSVRSGAAISMPGMMDTVLNLGLNDQTVKGLIHQTSDERFAYDAYRRFVQMFGKVVLEVKFEEFDAILEKYKVKLGVKFDFELTAEALKQIVKDYKALVKVQTHKEFPNDPFEQLRLAIVAVFDSWNTPRAIVYRRLNKISEDLCTAVNIQTMVFGNISPDSGTGVAFTRNPSTGEKKLYGEYLMNAQGEDVVAGIRTPKPVDQLAIDAPKMYKELDRICHILEKHFREMQDIEFTFEKGIFYMLQTRSGKRTAQAAVKVAVDMMKEGLITKEEAVLRAQPDQLDQLFHRRIDPSAKINVIAKGLPASPGAASGIVVFDVNEADKRGSTGEKVILVRDETTPEDIHGMVAAQGVLTSRGGMTSHAAVVARGMGKPCISGCEAIRIDLKFERFSVGDVVVKKGEVITIDGVSGQVIMGTVPMIDPELGSEVRELLGWADEFRKLGVRANADTTEAAIRSRDFGAEGIGLCRTERMFNVQDRLPIVQEMILAESERDRMKALDKLLPMQRGDFKEIFRALNGLPVTIRLLDPPLHEFLPNMENLLIEVTTMKTRGLSGKEVAEKERVLRKIQAMSEHNPMLGHRGVRLGIRYPEIYEMQTQAIFEAATELIKEGIVVKLEIMLPLVGQVSELKYMRERLEKVGKKVMDNAGVHLNYMFGTMMEVPRACLVADELTEYAEFFSFGTNDLTQTVYGYSRDDAEAKFIPFYLDKKILDFNPFEVLDQNGVGKLMKIAVENGRRKRSDLKIGICGEHGGEPKSIEFCHKLGLNYVSCSAFRVPIARLAAAHAKLKEEMSRSTRAND
ncbi:MAG: pyruvate, phosphate dikinase, partial [Candidatus Bathyarchaeota archaeon]